MIDEQEVLEFFIQSIEQQIEFLEAMDHDKVVFEGLKLLLSDNVTGEGKIRVRFSLMNKHFHLSFLSYKDFMHRYIKGNLKN